jgi:dephospho-CoA kinase
MLIGLTGLYCAGKNHIAALLEKRGLPVLDVDKLGHIVIENQKEAVFARFGEDVKNPAGASAGSVNRRLLGAKVFGNADELSALEAIVHPEANRLTEVWAAAQNGKNCVINAALLHKSSLYGRLGCVILVGAPWIVRLIRAKRRDNLPLAVLIQRLSKQKHFTSQYLTGKADIYKVENPGIGNDPGKTGAKLERRIDEILSKIELAQKTL